MRAILGASLIATTLPVAAVAGTSDSGVRAITGGSSQAITGGSAAAITGGSSQAITGGSAAAITGGSSQAITGGSAAAITGGSSQAITGGSAAAITGGSSQAITGGSAAAITGGSLLSGQIQSIDRLNGIFLAMGQSIRFSDSGIGSLQIGDYVTVGGSIAGAGIINADSVEVSASRYIPGASEVFVTGIPSSINYKLGTARIGGLTVDYTPSLSGDGFGGIGAAITVIGIQPALGGVMLGNRVIDKTELFLQN